MARPVHCAMHRGNTTIVIVYRGTNADMVSILAKGKETNEIIRQHGASKHSPDLPTDVSDVEKSLHTYI